MDLKHLTDNQLVSETKKLAQTEREVLTKILHHLREIDRRKLYCDFGCGSLFEYAVKQLKYSEGQASRRIHAMRLIKEIPQVEKSIASGELSLTNASQAQSLFRSMAKEPSKAPLEKKEKIEIINSLKNKSTREGQKELIKLQPEIKQPHEKERIITNEATEVRFVMNDKLKEKLEQVRALLGPKAIDLSYAELFDQMAEISLGSLKAKKFGKKRAKESQSSPSMEKEEVTPAPAPAKPSAEKVSRLIYQHFSFSKFRFFYLLKL